MFSLKIVDFQSSQFKFHDFLTQILAHRFTSFDFRMCSKERFSQWSQSRCKVWCKVVKYDLVWLFAGALDSGVPFLDEHDGSVGSKQLPTQSDMIICFPTQAGEESSIKFSQHSENFLKEDIKVKVNRVNQSIFLHRYYAVKTFNHKAVFSLSLWNLTYFKHTWQWFLHGAVRFLGFTVIIANSIPHIEKIWIHFSKS